MYIITCIYINTYISHIVSDKLTYVTVKAIILYLCHFKFDLALRPLDINLGNMDHYLYVIGVIRLRYILDLSTDDFLIILFLKQHTLRSFNNNIKLKRSNQTR